MDRYQLRTILNILFLILAVAAVVVYFTVDDYKTFMYVASSAVGVKLLEFFIRFTN